MTLSTLADILFQLGYKVKLTAKPLQEHSSIAAYNWEGAYSIPGKDRREIGLGDESCSLAA